VRRAVLLRGIQTLEKPPALDLSDTSVLALTGRDDAFARNAPALADFLLAHGARVDSRELSANHELAAADVAESAEWIQRKLSMNR
jgi:phospholipase/carboxylesterase